MATRKMRGYSLVMKPDGSSGKKTLKIYEVYEDDGGKACIQRVKEVNDKFKKQIREILGSGGIPEKDVVGNVGNMGKVGNVVENVGNLDNALQNLDENIIGANINSPANINLPKNNVQESDINFYQKKFNLLNEEITREDFKIKLYEKVDLVNKEFLKDTIDDPAYRFLKNDDDYHNNLFNKGGEITYNIPDEPITSQKLSELEFEYNTDVNNSKNDNVIILGGGPIGLYMAILLKTFIPKMDVRIFEKRSSKNNKRKLERTNVIMTSFVLQYFMNGNKVLKNLLKNIHLNNVFDLNTDNFNYLPNIMHNNFKSSGNYPINILELYLSNAAQSIGVLIVQNDVNNQTELETHINEKTLSVFDATGGRLNFFKPDWTIKNPPVRICSYITGEKSNLKENININKRINKTSYYLESDYDFYYSKCYENNYQTIDIDDIVNNKNNIKTGQFEFSVKGFNKNNKILLKNNTPLFSIGDSIRSVDFTTGTGFNIGILHSLIYALLFKKIHNMIENIPETENNITKNNKEINLEYSKESILRILKYINQLKTKNPNSNNQIITEMNDEINQINNEETFKEKINIILIYYYKLRYSLQNNKNIDYSTNIVIEDENLSKSIYEILTIYSNYSNYSNYLSTVMNEFFKKIYDNLKNFDQTINKKQIKGKIFAGVDYNNKSSDYLLLTQNKNNYRFIFVHYIEPTVTPDTENNTPDDATKLAIATAAFSANVDTNPRNNGGKTQKNRPKRKRSIFSIKK